MGDLRIKAQDILKAKQQEKEYEEIREIIPEEKNIKEYREKSRVLFTEKIQKEIDDFQTNLLHAADNGEPLKIDILQLNDENLVSWWEERDKELDTSTLYREYSPIKSGVVTFIDDINLKLLKDDIIIDSTLEELYMLICKNDIYPEWRVEKKDGKVVSLYLEVNPLVSYREKKDEFRKDIKRQERALTAVKESNKISQKELEDEFKKDRLLKNTLIFIPIFYLAVALFTIIGSALGLSSLESTNSASNFIGVAWPYFLVTDFASVSELFILSLPLGLIVALYLSYSKS